MADSHSHSAGSQRWGKPFALGIGLNTAFVAVEAIYGMISNSSALLADAGHNASDVMSLIFAWAAIWIASKKPSGRYSYGLRRTTVLASLLNALLIIGAAGYILWHAIERINRPIEVESTTIVVVAGIGVVINTITALMFMRGHKEDLNIKGAFLHMAADAAISLGVVSAGLAIRYTNAYWIDPTISIGIVIVIVYGTWGLLKDSVALALDAVPKSVNLNEIRNYLESLSGINEVHDLHVWGMSTTETALTAHLVSNVAKDNEFLFQVSHDLHERFGVDHTTVQLENNTDGAKCPCQDCD